MCDGKKINAIDFILHKNASAHTHKHRHTHTHTKHTHRHTHTHTHPSTYAPRRPPHPHTHTTYGDSEKADAVERIKKEMKGRTSSLFVTEAAISVIIRTQMSAKGISRLTFV